MTEPNYPECSKWAESRDSRMLIERFIDFARGRGVRVSKHDLYDRALYTPIEPLLYEFFDVDPEKLETERQSILDSLRGAP